MKLLDLLVLLKKAEKYPDVQKYLEAEDTLPFGWITKDDVRARRDKAEASVAKLQVQFEEFLKSK